MRFKLLLGVIVLGLIAGSYVVVIGSLKDRIEQQMTDACFRAVTVESVSLTLPLGVRVRGLRVPRVRGERRDPISAQEVVARIMPDAFFQSVPGGDLEVTRPQVFLEWSPEVQQAVAAWKTSSGDAQAPPQAAVMRRLRIREGEFSLLDQTVRPEVPWLIRGLALSAQAGVRPGEWKFSALGGLADVSGEKIGQFELDGHWMMQGPGEVKASLSYDKLKQLAPYIQKVLGTAPFSGSVDLETKITFNEQRGLIIAENELTVTNIQFPSDAPTKLGPDGNRLAELLSDENGVLHLGFVVTGRAGEALDWSDLATGALREAMRQALSRSIRRVLIETEQGKPLEELIQKGIESLGR